MNRLTRPIALLMCFILILSSAADVNAVEMRSSDYFSSCSVSLERTSSSSFNIWFDVVAKGTPTPYELGATTIRVERSTDCENWTTVQRYYSADWAQMIAYNTGSHDGYVPYSGDTGYYYRAVIGLYCRNVNGTGISYHVTETIYM